MAKTVNCTKKLVPNISGVCPAIVCPCEDMFLKKANCKPSTRMSKQLNCQECDCHYVLDPTTTPSSSLLSSSLYTVYTDDTTELMTATQGPERTNSTNSTSVTDFITNRATTIGLASGGGTVLVIIMIFLMLWLRKCKRRRYDSFSSESVSMVEIANNDGANLVDDNQADSSSEELNAFETKRREPPKDNLLFAKSNKCVKPRSQGFAPTTRSIEYHADEFDDDLRNLTQVVGELNAEAARFRERRQDSEDSEDGVTQEFDKILETGLFFHLLELKKACVEWKRLVGLMVTHGAGAYVSIIILMVRLINFVFYVYLWLVVFLWFYVWQRTGGDIILPVDI